MQRRVFLTSLTLILPIGVALLLFGTHDAKEPEPANRAWQTVLNLQLPAVIDGHAHQIARVVIDNPFDERLELHTIDLGCVCLTAQLAPTTIPAHGSSVLTVTLKPLNQHGVFGQRVTVRLNNASGRGYHKHVMVNGEVLPRADISPDTVDFGEIKANTSDQVFQRVIRLTPRVNKKIELIPQTSRLTVEALDTTNIPHEPLSVTDVPAPLSQKHTNSPVPSSPHLPSQPTRDTRTTQHFLLKLTVTPKDPPGAYRDEIRIAYSGELASKHILPVLFTLKPLVLAAPQRIVLADAQKSKTYLSTVTIRPIGGQELPTPTVRYTQTGGALHHEITRTDEGYRLHLTFTPPDSLPFFSDRIVVRFGDAEVAVPFVANIKD